MRVRLLKKYVRDIEWWIAYPADPKWTYHNPGDVMDVSDEEAVEMLKDEIAEPLSDANVTHEPRDPA